MSQIVGRCSRRGLMAVTVACAVALVAPAGSSAAIDTVFGTIACAPQEGVRFCQGTNPTRVKTFDGVPLDVNVTLPATGDGGFPLVVTLHGYGGSKSGLDAASKRYAAKGIAVLSYTARGFNGSCGTLPNRNDPGCLTGWLRLADSRFEARDTQHLAGLLADQGVIDGQRVGVTGISYGGGQSVELSVLRDRIRLPNGTYAPWVSPAKQLPMRIAATAPVIPWSDLVYSLVPNGRTLDYTVTDADDNLKPIGVLKTSFVAGLFALGQTTGFYAPPGVDPDADLTKWYARVNAGEPYDGEPMAEDIVNEISSNHSGYYLDMDRPPAPTLISNGFTDDLFPVDEAVRFANKVEARFPGTPVAQLHFDYGHQRGTNKGRGKPADNARLQSSIEAWFDKHLNGADVQTLEGVEALTQTCPAEAPSGGPFNGPNWLDLSPGEVSFVERAAKTVLSGPRDPQVDRAVDPIAAGNNPCATTSAADQMGTATYRLPKAEGDGYTLLGSPTVIADLTVTGVNAALATRLWDVAPDGSRQTLVARSLYRPNTSGRQVFQLHPNGYRFAPGHTAKLEVLGTDNPYGRTPNGQYQVAVSNLELRLPVAERPGSSPQVGGPAPSPLPPGATPVGGVTTVSLASTRPSRARSRTSAKARGRVNKERYRVRVTGRVGRRESATVTARDCRGRVVIGVRSAKRRVVRRTVRLRRDCSFSRRLVFRSARISRTQRRRGARARLRVVVAFRGNTEMSASRDLTRARLRRGG
ncbi:MAG: CocE/NonD family hydrolase [Thermoleophilaceae bacterium]